MRRSTSSPNWPFRLSVLLALTLPACSLVPTPSPTANRIDELIRIVRDPTSPDLASAADELSKLGASAARAVPSLAEALTYPRRDSIVAGQALVVLGQEALPGVSRLLVALGDDRPEVRRLALAVLGSIGPPARCAIPRLAPALWDPDPWVRTAAAAAMDAIAQLRLLSHEVSLDPSRPGVVFADEPEGTLTGGSRDWWLTEGKFLDWDTSASTCSP